MAAETGNGISHIAGEMPPGMLLPGDGDRPGGRAILGGVNSPYSHIQIAEITDDKRRGPADGSRLDTAGTRPYDIAWKGYFLFTGLIRRIR